MTTVEVPELPAVDRLGDEMRTLTEMLEFYRVTLVRKCTGLTEAQLAFALEMSPLTLGGLMYHMALVEDHWFNDTFLGKDPVQPWASAPWDDDPDWEFHTAKDRPSVELFSQLSESMARSRSVTEQSVSLEGVAAKDSGLGPCNLRWIMVHMIEEYARHCGHADLIREAVDGTTDR